MTSNIVFIVDNSSSVNNYVQQYTETINRILETQRTIDPNTLLSFITFNQEIDYQYINQPLGTINTPFNIKPNGITALYDNISTIIARLKNFSTITHSKPPLVIIITDGEDTASRFADKSHVYFQITMMQRFGWKFVFLGTTEEAVNIGKDMGCNVCILYTTNDRSFAEIVHVIGELLRHGVQHNEDIDIQMLTDMMMNTKI